MQRPRASALASGLATLAIAAACALATPTAATAADKHASGPKESHAVKEHAEHKDRSGYEGLNLKKSSCAGDTIYGDAKVEAAPGTRVTLELWQRLRPHASFVPTGLSTSFVVAAGQKKYPFSFDISALDAQAYRIVASVPGSRPQTIPAASCAPGREVPEAPFALLLPLSVVGVLGLTTVTRRRRRRVLLG